MNKQQRIYSLNEIIKTCNQCPLYLSRKHAICGEGNVNARIFFIAQAPGQTEDNYDRMFAGPTGKVMNELLGDAGIKKHEVYMTNLIKCILPKNRKPKQSEIDTCSHYLIAETDIVDPEFLIPLGYQATRFIIKYFCNTDYMPQDITGKLIYCSNRKIYPLRHPSSVLYNASSMQTMKQLFNKIPLLMKECKWYPVCPMKRFYEQGQIDIKWIECYCHGDWQSCVRYQMEESGRYHPDNMLPDGTIDKSLN